MTRRTGFRAQLAAWAKSRAGGAPSNLNGHNPHAPIVDGEFLSQLDRLSLQIGPDLMSGLLGEHRAGRRTTGIEFADYRPYSPGDDPRRVDWNAYARLGSLLVRQAQAEHETVLYILLDTSPSMACGTPGKLGLAARLAAALGYIALAHLDSVVLAAPGAAGSGEAPAPASQPTLLRGQAEAGRLFRLLGGWGVGSAAAWDGVLRGWSAAPGTGRAVVILSDLWRDDYQAGVRSLRAAGCAVTLIHILSPDERQPAVTGNLELVDSETGVAMEVHLGREGLAAYGARLTAWQAETAAWCRRYGVGLVPVGSEWAVRRVLLDTLRRQGVLA